MADHDNDLDRTPDQDDQSIETGDQEPGAETAPELKPARKPRARKPRAAASSESIETESEEKPAPRKRAPRRKKVAKESLALPVIITDETILLPHMSIPYPVEDDETARAIDRAMRMTPRYVLVLTERPVEQKDGESLNGHGPERDLIDMMTDLIAEEAGNDDYERVAQDEPAGDKPDSLYDRGGDARRIGHNTASVSHLIVE